MQVSALRTSPVKGLFQAQVEALELAAGGIVGDRVFVCADERDHRLYTMDLGPLALARASWDAVSRVLEVQLPGGGSVAAVVETVGEQVALGAPSSREMPGRRVVGPFEEALSEVAGRALRLYEVPVGRGSPGGLTIVGDGSVARLARELGVDGLDTRRFKMSFELEGVAEHEEERWAGRDLRLGGAVVRVGDQVPRCVLLTRDPLTMKRDHDTLRVLLSYREPMEGGEPPLGVYAEVVEPGLVRVGDPAVLVN